MNTLDNSHLIDKLDRAIAKLDQRSQINNPKYTFSEELKEQLVDFLIASDNKLVYDGSGDEFLNQILNKGFKGYSNFTFREVIDEFLQRFDSAVHLLEQLETFFDNYYLPANSKDEVTDIEVIEWVESFIKKVEEL